jgi:flagellin
MVVQHNISAMTANRYYQTNNSQLSKSIEKLSSGYAINRAGDNAAGLAVSEKMRAQIGGLTQASKNAEDGISMVQTYEGALQETDSILQRMRTLAVQSANGSYQSEVDRDAIQLEFDQLNDELNQIADTDYNGVVALNGGVMADGTVVNNNGSVAGRPTIQSVTASPDDAFTYSSSVNGSISAGGTGTISVNGISFDITAGAGSTTLGGTSYTAENVKYDSAGKTFGGTVKAVENYTIDDKTNTITIHGKTARIDGTKLYDVEDGSEITAAKLGGNKLTVTANTSVVLETTYTVGDSGAVTDESATPVTVGKIVLDKGVSKPDAYEHGARNLTYADSMTLQVGARAKDAVKFNFSYTSNGIGNLKSDLNASARGLGTDQLSVNTQEEANFAIDQIDNAINKVNMIRGTFGAIQNRLEHKISNIDTNTENLTAAESRIRDTQMDKEMMKFTSSQILSQASQSMLAQANQLPQGVLQLLG